MIEVASWRFVELRLPLHRCDNIVDTEDPCSTPHKPNEMPNR